MEQLKSSKGGVYSTDKQNKTCMAEACSTSSPDICELDEVLTVHVVCEEVGVAQSKGQLLKLSLSHVCTGELLQTMGLL